MRAEVGTQGQRLHSGVVNSGVGSSRGGGGGVDTSWPDDIAGASRAAGYAGYGKGPADSCKHGKK